VTPFQRRRLEAAMPHAGPSPPSSHVFRRPTWVPSHFGSSSSGSTSSSGASVRSRRPSDADTEAGGPLSLAGPNPQDSNVPDVENPLREKGGESDEDEEEFEIPQLTAIQVRSAALQSVAHPTCHRR
jgi:hypothetical protein